LKPRGGPEPGARIGRHAIARPLLHRGPERLVQGLLGEIEVAEQADQGGENATRLGTVNRVHDASYSFRRVLVHWGRHHMARRRFRQRAHFSRRAEGRHRWIEPVAPCERVVSFDSDTIAKVKTVSAKCDRTVSDCPAMEINILYQA